MADPQSAGAQILELEVGPVAEGGSCVARADGRVIFVRHALPGERVIARVTEERGSYWRADAVEVLRASPDRVDPPCPYAGPGRCGGCDWQHASARAQREMKAAVVCEHFRRLAGIDVAQLLGEVRDLPGGLLGWRTRITYAVDASGRVGLHRHRSRELEHVDQCPLGVPLVGDAPEIGRRWPGLSGLEINSGDGGARSVIAHRPGPGRQPRGRRPPDRVEVIDGAEALLHRVGERELRVRPTGFWQVHPHALRAFADEVVAATGVREGDRVLDLFAGAGALTVVLAEATGSTGSVLGLESDAGAVADAAANLADLPWAGVRRRRVDATSLGEHANRIDVVVLDPPRAGIGREVMTAVLALGARAVCYVSCDAATLARDVRAALDTGWRLTRLTAFDAFPMTAHVEVIATLVPPEAGS